MKKSVATKLKNLKLDGFELSLDRLTSSKMYELAYGQLKTIDTASENVNLGETPVDEHILGLITLAFPEKGYLNRNSGLPNLVRVSLEEERYNKYTKLYWSGRSLHTFKNIAIQQLLEIEHNKGHSYFCEEDLHKELVCPVCLHNYLYGGGLGERNRPKLCLECSERINQVELKDKQVGQCLNCLKNRWLVAYTLLLYMVFALEKVLLLVPTFGWSKADKGNYRRFIFTYVAILQRQAGKINEMDKVTEEKQPED